MNATATARMNHLFPAACPACDQIDTCSHDCICPTCKSGCTAECLDLWRTFAPVLAVFNAEGAYWGWTGTHGKHSVEVGRTVDITYYNGEFIVAHYERTHAATRLDQEQGTWIDVYCGPDPETAAAEAYALAVGDR